MTTTKNINIYDATRSDYEKMYTKQLRDLLRARGKYVYEITGGYTTGHELTTEQEAAINKSFDLIKSVLSTRENILSNIQKKALRKLRSEVTMSEESIRKTHHWPKILDIK